jgi:PAS domain S-box-containing protein
MAPSTAVCMILLGAALFLSARPARGRFSRFAGMASTIGVCVISACVLLGWVTGLDLNLERFLDRAGAYAELGRMSPLAAAAFLLVCVSFLFLRGAEERLAIPIVPALYSATVICVSAAACAGYLCGMPSLYGGQTVTIAFMTAFAFLFLGIGLFSFSVSAVRRSGGKTFTRDSMQSVFLLAVFVLFSSGIFLAGYQYYEREEAEFRRAAADQLSAIAELKVGRIEEWRTDWVAQAKVFASVPLIADHVRQLVLNPRDASCVEQVKGWMGNIVTLYGYESVVVADPGGNGVLSVPAGQEMFSLYSKATLLQAMRERDIVLSDFYRGAHAKTVITLAVPIADPAGAVAGALLLRVDPQKYLYPLIQSWPTPSRTAETLLVRCDGNDVLFLNELRHRKDTALRLRLPVSDERLPAAMAVRGIEGIVEGTDYRQVPVLADIQKVSGSPWYLIAKIDADEVYAPLRDQARLVLAFISILLFAAGMALAFIWNRQQTRFELKENEAKLERLALTQHFDYLTKFANDIILLLDGEHRILEANDRALEAYGYSRGELLRMDALELRAPEDRPGTRVHMEEVEHAKGLVYESRHRRKNGTIFPVEVSARMIEAEEKKYYQYIIRDITERRKSEAIIATYQLDLEMMVEKRTRQLKEAHEKLERTERLAALGKFAGSLAHELRNPLSVVASAVAYLTMPGIPIGPDEQKETMQVIRRQTEMAARIVDNTLDFANPKPLELKAGAISTDIENALAVTVIPPGIAVEKEYKSSREILCDHFLLEHVFTNLIRNGVQAVKNKGVIKIRTVDEKEGVTVTIEDTGCGIAPEDLQKLFQPLFSKKPRGIGLGLYIVKGIIERHKGTIEVKSETGKGTMFVIRLPFVK